MKGGRQSGARHRQFYRRGLFGFVRIAGHNTSSDYLRESMTRQARTLSAASASSVRLSEFATFVAGVFLQVDDFKTISIRKQAASSIRGALSIRSRLK
jgi:hypothetical protein